MPRKTLLQFSSPVCNVQTALNSAAATFSIAATAFYEPFCLIRQQHDGVSYCPAGADPEFLDRVVEFIGGGGDLTTRAGGWWVVFTSWPVLKYPLSILSLALGLEFCVPSLIFMLSSTTLAQPTMNNYTCINKFSRLYIEQRNYLSCLLVYNHI